jgi:hypothetical protein
MPKACDVFLNPGAVRAAICDEKTGRRFAESRSNGRSSEPDPLIRFDQSLPLQSSVCVELSGSQRPPFLASFCVEDDRVLPHSLPDNILCPIPQITFL